MILAFWFWLRGYVRLTVTGFSVERFLNMAAFHKIYMWNVTRTEAGVELNTSIRGFKMLRNCTRKTKCRTRIREKHGLPFILHRYRKRKLLMAGVLFFVAAMFALSSFVWKIDVIGTETLHHDEVRAFLAERGLQIGTLKYRINREEKARALLSQFPEIGFANIHTRGTRTTVLLAEAIPVQPLIDRTTPTHVVADRDGLITTITAGAGAPLVRTGDVVQAGEMLVSGYLQIQPDMPDPEYVYVHAYAQVWARRYYPIEFAIPLSYEQRIFTGNVAHRHALQFLFAGSRVVNLPGGGISFTDYDRITTQHQPGVGGDYPLPVVWLTTRYAEFVMKQRTRTLTQARELAERQLTARILREFDFGIDIVEKRVSLEETPEALLISALIITNERIDKMVPIEGATPWNPRTPPEETSTSPTH